LEVPFEFGSFFGLNGVLAFLTGGDGVGDEGFPGLARVGDVVEGDKDFVFDGQGSVRKRIEGRREGGRGGRGVRGGSSDGRTRRPRCCREVLEVHSREYINPAYIDGKSGIYTTIQSSLLGGGPALVDDAAGVFLPPSPPEALHELGRLVDHLVDTVLSGLMIAVMEEREA
jgi:hypothetical protein